MLSVGDDSANAVISIHSTITYLYVPSAKHEKYVKFEEKEETIYFIFELFCCTS
jgi:hypothetical protein